MTLKLNGSTSGSVSIDAPASTAGGAARTLSLPDDSGNGVIKTSTYPSSIQVLEQFFTPCDGSVIATSAGNVTVGDVDAAQDISTSYADVTGSSISYTPPTGTTQVIYEYLFQYTGIDAQPITHFKLFLDSDEVAQGRRSCYFESYDNWNTIKWGFNIGGLADTNVGRVASWSSAKTIKLQVREYSSSHEALLHRTELWDGSTGQHFSIPSIGITAIGAA